MTSRRFTTRRRISLSDTDADGRLRLDAVARYLQDVASDDWLDAGFDHDSHVWVVRRTELTVHESFRPEDAIELATWCSGIAGSSAARRYSIRGDHGGHIEAESIWIHLDHVLHPKRLDARFLEIYGASAKGRRPSTRFTLRPPSTACGEPWPFRRTDQDRLGHVNNAAFWAPLEEAWAGRLGGRLHVVLEYRRPIDVDEHALLAREENAAWLLVGDDVRAAAILEAA
ncbi:MAG TPA: acyl-ACP thioesterase domain-containing protein [Gaiellaceae bacterium]|nr:acyl-ACP thioesterase domain-containing protein [Gaiellaceae bacterium]